ncbi:hypothetical protein HD806DRAFT_535164 [Xylariaceae sp. AK1471]|nr:hypothetical protein HD806DRAFT_535164 [Xylariaceae sp. AK1471]
MTCMILQTFTARLQRLVGFKSKAVAANEKRNSRTMHISPPFNFKHETVSLPGLSEDDWPPPLTLLSPACLACVFVMFFQLRIPHAFFLLLIQTNIKMFHALTAFIFPLRRITILKEKAAASRLGVAGANNDGTSSFGSPRKAPRAPPSPVTPVRTVAPVAPVAPATPLSPEDNVI